MDNSDRMIASAKADVKMYIEWLELVDTAPAGQLLLAGGFRSPAYPVWPRNHDNFHYPLGMELLLTKGFYGIKETARKNADQLSGNRRAYLLLVCEVYEAVIRVVSRFACDLEKAGHPQKAAICRALTLKKPETFIQACQLYWFATLFRIGTATIGRMDQHLFPFYKRDQALGRLDRTTAFMLVKELVFRYEQRGDRAGDTLQNITLSGRDASGQDQTNELTYLILEAYNQVHYLEPKINIRVHSQTPQLLKEWVARLQMNGSGNCTLFNDEAVIDGLISYGRPLPVACDYCADGCSEIILDGHGETAFRYIDCIKAVEHVLFNGRSMAPEGRKLQYYDRNKESVEVRPPVKEGKKTGIFDDMKGFEDFMTAYYSQLEHQVKTVLASPYNSDENSIRIFTAATLPGVLETGLDPFINENCYHTYGLFIGSLGTAVNSLYAVKKLVYEEKSVDKTDLVAALTDDFKGHENIRRKCLGHAKFGNDIDSVDALAVEVAEKFADMVALFKDRLGRQILPGLYNHLFHHSAFNTGATPDGRRYGDPVGEHLSPTPGTALTGPSGVINSVTKINTARQIFGSTLHLNIPKLSLNGSENGISILMALNEVFCSQKGCVMNVNVLDAKTLMEAQQHPERYKDLVVRVWGFSYYFCLLSKEMQDHIISRAQSS